MPVSIGSVSDRPRGYFMLATINLVILLVWLLVELVPGVADGLARMERFNRPEE